MSASPELREAVRRFSAFLHCAFGPRSPALELLTCVCHTSSLHLPLQRLPIYLADGTSDGDHMAEDPEQDHARALASLPFRHVPEHVLKFGTPSCQSLLPGASWM
eukprot:3717231-Pyramimonas_sp.AAC.1